ncbi:MAG: NrfD/PsrC family molybdoenzyme membrane anchor subunit [bacterium]
MFQYVNPLAINGSYGTLENIYWGLPIVIYPFLSGLLAGSFVVGALYHLFHVEKLKPVSQLSLIASFAMLLIAAIAPLADALQPSRAIWELYLRDHFPYSPLGMFIIIWTIFAITFVFELYYLFREKNIKKMYEDKGIRGKVSKILTLGSTDLSKESIARDHKALWLISILGIILSILFHGYVGFLFGAIKARALWSDPVIPPMFIASAVVSGIAFVGLLYIVGFGLFSNKNKVEPDTLGVLNKSLVYAIFADLFFDLIEWLYSVREYNSKDVYDAWHAVYSYAAHGPLWFNYHVLQIGLGLIIPAFLFLFFKKVRRSLLWTLILDFIVTVSVFEMRFNTVIGAQLPVKIGQGLVNLHIPFWGYDGYLTGIGLFGLGLVIIFVLGYFLGWEHDPEELSVPPKPKFKFEWDGSENGQEKISDKNKEAL